MFSGRAEHTFFQPQKQRTVQMEFEPVHPVLPWGPVWGQKIWAQVAPARKPQEDGTHVQAQPGSPAPKMIRWVSYTSSALSQAASFSDKGVPRASSGLTNLGGTPGHPLACLTQPLRPGSLWGWRLDTNLFCLHVPGLPGRPSLQARTLPRPLTPAFLPAPAAGLLSPAWIPSHRAP